MGHGRFKMYSTERISILLLIAALCAFAAVTMCSRIPREVEIVSPVQTVTDTIAAQHFDSIVILSKTGRSKKDHTKKRKKRKKGESKKNVDHRDHLNEPVTPF